MDCDVVVVGAGISGLYLVHAARRRGLSVVCVEAGAGLGGTWFWNRYPGCRVDIESFEYSYSFSPELEQDWSWSERYAAQPEVLRYLEHVADRFELRDSIRFSTRVTAARFEEASGRWRIETDRGPEITAQFCVMATGLLSEPLEPSFPGLDDFAGRHLMTSRWPTEPVSFAGASVGVIGTAASGIQVIPRIADAARRLTVFQRTASFTVPIHNRPIGAEVERRTKARYAELRRAEAGSFAGMANHHQQPEAPATRSALAVSAEERLREYEDRWQSGGLSIYNAFTDLLTDPAANRTAEEFVARKMRESISKPGLADRLIPTAFPIMTRRLPGNTNYCETFDRDHVRLVDLRETPIERFVREGVRLSDGETIALDAVVFATGFDVATGAMSRIDIRGRGGVTLAQHWADGIRTYLGMMAHGFPNFFWVQGPGYAFVNGFQIAEYQGDWIDRAMAHARANRIQSIEPTVGAESAWTAHHREVADATLFPKSDNYYMGDNVPGKPRVPLFYFGGFPLYRQHCEAAVERSYADLACA